jgi:protein-S-isoprenylcysteine O-methyltransferase Ste14
MDRIAAFAAARRVPISRAVGVVIVALACVSAPSWDARSWPGVLAAAAGLVLTAAGALGRVWCALHIEGRKDDRLVREGPYSLVRHPLYACSFLGATGLALASRCAWLLVAVPALILAFYPLVVRNEEATLRRRHGDAWLAYRAAVPAVFPRSLRTRSPERLDVDARLVARAITHSLAFLLVYAGLQLVDRLKADHLIPILLR